MDPQQQHAANMLAGMGIGFIGFVFLLILLFLIFTVFCLWRIFTKAGLSGALSLLIFIPGIGSLVVLCVLAFADWKVTPLVPAPYYPPAYPPTPPAYPPTPPPQV
jgi:uncharacterized membrane protein YhaH (DUF805 family)